MHRQKLLNQLLRYRDTSPDEHQKVDGIIKFVKENPTCFDRELEAGHITGSAWLVNHTGEKALLGLHKKLGIWTQLGGHADGDSDVLQVALREAQEESGINSIEPFNNEIFDVDVHLISARPNEPEHTHYDIRYFLRVTKDAEFKINDEMMELRWINAQDALKILQLDQSIIRMIKKWTLR